MLRKLVSGVTVAVLMATGLIASCSKKEVQTETQLRPVRYVEVYATGGTRERTFSGVARAGIESRLSFRVAGTIERLAVKVGDRVKAGDLIAQLDRKDYQLQVDEASAALEQARAQARNAAASYERVRALYENRNASRNDLDQARAADESARAAVESVSKRLELAKSQLAYTRLTAPVEGAIAEVSTEVNENVKAGNSIALLTSGARMEVEVGIPDILIAEIREGDRVSVSFDALTGQTFAAAVSEVGVAATGMVTTFPVTVLLDREDPNVRPGMAAQVMFQFRSDDPRERFIVPSVAVGEDRSGRFVYVVQPEGAGVGVVHKRDVTIGELLDHGIEVFDGLQDGDLVLTAGIHKVSEGMRVQLPQAEDTAS